jgi:hypothetical protein
VAGCNLASYLRELGQVAAARTLNEDTLKRCRRVLGPDHPDTLGTANNLALDLYALGQIEAAGRSPNIDTPTTRQASHIRLVHKPAITGNVPARVPRRSAAG